MRVQSSQLGEVTMSNNNNSTLAVDHTHPPCLKEPRIVEHWLQRYPKFDILRQSTFGSPSPPLGVHKTDPKRCLRSQMPPSRALYARLSDDDNNNNKKRDSRLIFDKRRDKNQHNIALVQVCKCSHSTMPAMYGRILCLDSD